MDELRQALIEEADRRAAGVAVPPLSEVRDRATRHRRRRRLQAVAAPVVVAALAAGVAVAARPGAPAPTSPTATTAPLAVPPPVLLGRVVLPKAVRARLHSPDADLLAVSPPGPDGAVLRLAGVRRGMQACAVAYEQPSGRPVDGGGNCVDPQLKDGIEVVTPAGPGRAFVEGYSPVGTAAVVLRAPDRADLVVPVGDPGTAWESRPRYVAFWPQVGTDVIAVDRAGRELARGRIPSPVPAPPGPGDPELGTLETPALVRQLVAPRLHADVVPPRLDVLAHLAIGPGRDKFTVGYQTNDGACWFDIDVLAPGQAPSDRGGAGCGYLGGSSGPLTVSRSFSTAGVDGPAEELVEGSAPAGADRVRLTAPGLPAVEVPATSGGPRWRGRSYYLASFPTKVPVQVTALAADGSVLGSVSDKSLDPEREFDPRRLKALADCLEKAGIPVQRIPQPGADPAYSYPQPPTEVQTRCEAEADQAIGG